MAAMADLVRLRRLLENDLASLHRWYQTPELWDHLVGEFTPRAGAEAVAHMRSWLRPTPVELRLAIVRGEDGEFMGLVSLTPIDLESGEAEFHIFVGEPEHRGHGYGRAATAAMLAHAFDELALWRVRLRVLRSNEAALRVYAALGFEPEGPGEVAVLAMSVTDAVFRERQAAVAPRTVSAR
jgi:RimJ/RimL family protein N-acetyltransferase